MANSAPVLDSTGDMSLSSIGEDPVSNDGNTVSGIIATSTANNSNAVTDADPGAAEGIAVTAVTDTNGTWQYKVGSNSWANFPNNISESKALLLSSTDSVRFVPNTNYYGSNTGSITFRAWDQTTSEVAGNTTKITSTGSTTAFSTATETATITVTPVADAPTVTTASTNEDTQTSSGLVIGRNANDGTEVTHFKISGITGGTLYKNDGTTVIANDTFITVAEGNTGLKFTPSSNSTSNGSFAVQGSTDNAGSGLSATTTATISVVSVNDAPVLDNSGTMTLTAIGEDPSTNNGNTVASIIATSTANGSNAITDIDASAVEGIAITAVTNTNGTWEFENGNKWDPITVSASSHLLLAATDTIRFVPNANYHGSDTGGITFRAWDTASGKARNTADTTINGGTTAFSTATEFASITVTPVADAPTVTTASTNEDTQTSSGLVIGRNANDGTEVTHFKISGITGGTLYKNDGTTVIANDTFITVAEGNTGLKFTPSSNSTSNGSFAVQGSTDNAGSGLSATTTATISVVSVNDAPVLDNSGTMTLTAIGEDPSTNNGNTVASIIATSTANGSNAITDIDASAVEGIAITAVTNTNGTWQYQIGTKGSWTNIPTDVANDKALLLAASTDSLRFVPNTNYHGSDTGGITFRAWDTTSGTAGSTIDTTTHGGSTAFSTATETASITVNSVNDAPVLDNSGAMALTAISEDTSTNNGNTVASIIATSTANGGNAITDADSGAVEGIAITAATNSKDGGIWQYKIADGSWIDISVSSNSHLLLADTANIRFVPNADYYGTADITFRAWDRTSGTTGGTMDTSPSNGGSTAFSSVTESAAITVSAINDAPVINAGATLAYTENASATVIDSALTLTDVDDTQITGATIAISAGYTSGDTLGFANTGGIAGSYNSDTGVLTLTGTASVTNYRNALRSVTFLNSSDNPTASAASRTVTWTVTDANGSNASNGTRTSSSATSTVNITAINDAPVITSNGGGATASISLAEKNLAVTTVTATDAEGGSITYSLTGGADQAKFTLNATTGALSFITAPAFSAPTDTGADNIYNVQVTATDNGALTDVQDIAITITGNSTPANSTGNDGTLSTTTAIDGANLIIQTNPDNSQTIFVPILTIDRQEDTSSLSPSHADIPVIKDSAGNPVLTVSIPAGVGLVVIRKTESLNVQIAADELINHFLFEKEEAHHNQKILTHGNDSLLSLKDAKDFYIQTITPTTVSTKILSAPIFISGPDKTENSKQAVIINTTQLPSGTVIQLNNVAFAAIVGNAHIVGGAGKNFVVSDNNVQFIVLGADDDVLFGGGGNDTIGSLDGDDQTSGDEGDDTVFGGTGNDRLSGGSGNDRLNGGLGFDRATQAGALPDYHISVQDGAVTLASGDGETDIFTDIELIRFDTGSSLAVAYTETQAAAHYLAKTWLNRDLTAEEGAAVQNWKDATLDDILTAFHSLPEAAGFQDKTAGELLAGLAESPEIIRLDIQRDILVDSEDNQGYLPLGLSLEADGDKGYDVLRMLGSLEDVHLQAIGERLELTRLADGAMLSIRNAEAITFDSGDTVVFAHDPVEAVLGRLFHSFFDRSATADEWRQGKEALDAQVNPQVILDWLRQNSNVSNLTDSEYIQNLFVQTLGRNASGTEFDYYLNRLENGQIDRDWLAVVIANGQEAATHLANSVIVQENWI